MATGPKLVHKQFNSPIGLYSQRNIQETLGKHLQNLDNGTVGIDFNNPNTDKPANLANSAVLRMLEEENQNRRGNLKISSHLYSELRRLLTQMCNALPELDPTQIQAILDTMVRVNRRFDETWPPKCTTQTYGRTWNGEISRLPKGPKKVVWPPTPETNGYHSSQQQSPAFYNSAQHSPQAQSQPQSHYQPEHQVQPQYQQPQYQQPQYQQPQYQPPQNQPQYYPESQPAHCEGKKQQATGFSKLIPFGPGATASRGSTSPGAFRPGPPSPGAFRQGPPSPAVAQPVAQPFRAPQNRWATVPAPLSPQPQSNQSYPQQYSPQPPQYSPQAYSEPAYEPPQRQFEPPPSTITLRQQQPVHQRPPPVFASQPATASFQGGVNMRGDQKWPPQEVKEAVAAENEARRQLAKGPACRPRKVKKDYASFFAQNALNQNYPGYRAPPGTQHFEDYSGRSSY